jgi:hypothetical protein
VLSLASGDRRTLARFVETAVTGLNYRKTIKHFLQLHQWEALANYYALYSLSPNIPYFNQVHQIYTHVKHVCIFATAYLCDSLGNLIRQMAQFPGLPSH